MGSYEVQSCAFAEAFAHFYAADVWNSHSQADCSFAYYKNDVPIQDSCSPSCPTSPTSSCYSGKCYARPVVDCSQPDVLTCDGDECSTPERVGTNVGYYSRHMETLCGGPFGDRGVEVDWLRTFWTVHTRGTSPPTFTSMRQWLSGAYAFGTFGSPYQRIDYEANQEGGTLNSNWDFAKAFWGVDHP
jgi:hypothetical protein